MVLRKWELRKKDPKVEEDTLVVSFSCLIGLQNLGKSCSQASQIYKVHVSFSLHSTSSCTDYSLKWLVINLLSESL